MDWEAFFTVHKDLPREGPGAPEDVQWMLEQTGLSGQISVCDAGCGPGADAITLAEMLPEAQVTGIEQQAQFVEFAKARCFRFGDRVRVEQGDMADPGGPYDLIWCAGALYFLGVAEGLRHWKDALTPGGWVAFSEPVKLSDPMPNAATAFWEEYPQITDLQGIADQVSAAGFEMADHRLITGEPWANYYAPMKTRLEKLSAGDPGDALMAAIEDARREIALWEAAPDDIAYVLVLARP